MKEMDCLEYNWSTTDKVKAKITVDAMHFSKIHSRIRWCDEMGFHFFVDFHTSGNNDYEFGYFDFCFSKESDAVLFSLRFEDT